MSVMISDTEYSELQTLRSYCIREKNIASAKSMQELENDIDMPMRTIVGMFALLGCKPLFSCCGFDYDDQPVHKTHEYGNAYVMLQNNSNVEQLITLWLESKFLVGEKKTSQWRMWKDEPHKIVFIALAFDWAERKSDYPWTKHNCIHYSEKGVIGLHILRELLYRYRDSFLANFTLKDSNENQNNKLAYWQYPTLEPWEINKDDLLLGVEKELSLG